MKIPPKTKNDLTPPNELCNRLSQMVGQDFHLTGKTRTDGSNMRRKIEETLSSFPLPEPAPNGSYCIIPPKGKGVPKIRREFLDSYIVTTGNAYNLQVWNRNPATDSVQIEYDEGEPLLTSDVRFVFTKVNTETEKIESVIILTPDYIVKNFGKFGKPTIKHQLIITEKERAKILSLNPPILFYSDHPSKSDMVKETSDFYGCSIHDIPDENHLLDLNTIKDIVQQHLIGTRLDNLPTKNRGQALELKMAQLLGYTPSPDDLLAGGYPDIRHQALEVKVQDSPTIDLGKYSPQFEEDLETCPGFKSTTMRYLLALTDEATGTVKGAVVCPGYRLGEHFTYVANTSFKCQRSIPMDFFNQFNGEVIFNP